MSFTRQLRKTCKIICTTVTERGYKPDVSQSQNVRHLGYYFIPTLFNLLTKFILPWIGCRLVSGGKFSLFLDLNTEIFLEHITSTSIQITITPRANHFMTRCILGVAKNKFKVLLSIGTAEFPAT